MNASSRPQSFLFVIDVLEAGGVQQDVLKIGRALLARGDRCTVAAFRSDRDALSETYRAAGLPVVFLGKRRTLDVAFLRRLRELLRRGEFDFVHALSPQAAFWTALALPRGRRPVFAGFLFNTHSFDRVIPRVLESLVVAPRADAMVVNSRAGKRYYRRRIASPPTVICVPNGVDSAPTVDRERVRTDLGIGPDEFAIGCVGRLVPVKRHEDLLKALAALRRENTAVRLFLVGDGPLRNSLESAARQLGIRDAVEFLGERRDPRTLLAAFDLFALPSESEGMPNALLEAMAAGLACVATPVGGVPELIADGRSGCLVPVRSPESLAKAIRDLRNTPQRRYELGRAARESIQRAFTAEHMTRRLLAHYDRLLRTRRADIAYVFSQFPKLSETFLLRELVEMRRRGLGCCVVSLKPSRDTVVQPDAVALRPFTISLPWMGSRVLLAQGEYVVKHPLRYVRAFAEGVFRHLGFGSQLLKWLAVWPKTVATARELHWRGVRHVHATWATIPAASALAMARLLGCSFSFSAHAFDIHGSRHPLAAKIRKAAFVTTCTQRNVDHLRSLVPDGMHRRIHLVRHFLEFPDTLEPRAPDTPPLILSVGSLERYKGHAVLLHAAARLAEQPQDFRLRIVGGGPEKETLQNLARSLAIGDRVEFTGPLPLQAVFGSLRRATVFALASLRNPQGGEDNLPNVLVEAAAARVPCVVSRIGAVTEFLSDGESALLVEPGDPSALAAALGRLLSDPALRERLADRAHTRARTLFARDTNAAALEHLFCSALTPPGPMTDKAVILEV